MIRVDTPHINADFGMTTVDGEGRERHPFDPTYLARNFLAAVPLVWTPAGRYRLKTPDGRTRPMGMPELEARVAAFLVEQLEDLELWTGARFLTISSQLVGDVIAYIRGLAFQEGRWHV